MMQNKVYWLTGGSGSGKSAAAEVMRSAGVYVIDSDKVSHDILKKGGRAYGEVLDKFGEDFLDENKEINRRALGKAVFADKEKLEILNSVTHKYIKEEIVSLLNKNGTTVIDAPLPHHGFLEADHVLYITAPRKLRISRIMQRDGISHEEAEARLDKQKYIDEYIKDADTIIENDGDIEKFKAKIKNWCEYEKII